MKDQLSLSSTGGLLPPMELPQVDRGVPVLQERSSGLWEGHDPAAEPAINTLENSGPLGD